MCLKMEIAKICSKCRRLTFVKLNNSLVCVLKMEMLERFVVNPDDLYVATRPTVSKWWIFQ